MQQLSAGLLMYRHREGILEVLLVHPGGPYYWKKDLGVWSLPKGEPEPGEELLATAQREFTEETSFTAQGPFLPLTPIRQRSGKLVHAWAFAGDCDPAALVSSQFSLEWPPKSRRRESFPEVDRAEFFALPEARQKMNPAQVSLLDELEQILRGANYV